MPLMLTGVGAAMLFVPLTTAVLGGVPQRVGAKASAYVNLGTQLGGSIAIAALSTLVDRRVAFHLAAVGRETSPGCAGGLATAAGQTQSPAALRHRRRSGDDSRVRRRLAGDRRGNVHRDLLGRWSCRSPRKVWSAVRASETATLLLSEHYGRGALMSQMPPVQQAAIGLESGRRRRDGPLGEFRGRKLRFRRTVFFEARPRPAAFARRRL